MALDDNPFDSGTAGAPPAEAGTREPVPFDIGAVVTRAWELLTENVVVVLAAILIPVAITMVFAVPSAIARTVAENTDEQGVVLVLSLAATVLSLLQMIVNIYLELGVTRIFANLAYGRPARIGMIFGEAVRLPAALLAAFLLTIGIVFGFVLLIVPGIILALGLGFFVYGLIDQDLGPIESLQESWRLTNGHKAFLFLFALVTWFVGMLVTVFTCGLGLFVVGPVLGLSQAVLYHAMVHEKGRAAEAQLG